MAASCFLILSTLYGKGENMKIEYKEIKEFTSEQLEELFLSVNWQSGKYPRPASCAGRWQAVLR